MANRYSKALKHLKSTEIDEKIKGLEEAAPTNNMGGVYYKGPAGQRFGNRSPEKVFYPDADGNFPSGIPGTAGDPSYTRPEGYWDSGPGATAAVEYDNVYTVDWSHPDSSNVRDTSGLIQNNGYVKSQLPPGSRSFILGPLVDGYTFNHGYDDFTNIGYIQKDTRQFILLARISGHWNNTDPVYNGNPTSRVWDGTATGFTAYNENFTLAMAQWFRNKMLNGKEIGKNVSYYYSGGIGQLGNPDPDAPSGSYGGNGVGGPGHGSGGEDDANTGSQQNDPEHGGWDPNDPPNAKDDEKKDEKKDEDNDEREALLKAAAELDRSNKRQVDYLNSLNDVKIADAGVLSIPAGIATWKLVSLVAAAYYMSNAELRSALSNWNGIIRLDDLFGPKYGPKPAPQYGREWVKDGNGNWVDKKSGMSPKEADMWDKINKDIEKAGQTDGESGDSSKDSPPRTNPKKRFPGGANWSNSYEPQGQVLSESRSRILREIKKPVVVPELPKKYKMNFKGKFRPQNTPDVTASKESDQGVKAKNAAGQAWRTNDKSWATYETNERMNIIFDQVGHGNQAWDMIVAESKRKNGWKNREIQEQLNIIAHEKAMRAENPDYESPWSLNEMGASSEEELNTIMKDPLVKKVAKRLKTQIDYEDKPARQGYPNDPPPKQVDGWHPKYGKKYKYDKLDPVSAVTMRNAPTGDPEIDANVDKAAKKLKPKVKVEEKLSSWRTELNA